MRRYRTNGKKGFTLIELLVVVAIIILLAAILLPSLAKARESAKGASCLSNMHNIGLALQMYTNSNHNYFPSSYFYINGASSAGGYIHWTASIDQENYAYPVNAGKYPKNAPQYVCSSHSIGGFAPTNFTTTRIPVPPAGQATQTAGIDDKQAPRLSYVPNEVIMPRKKFSGAYDQANPATGTQNLKLVQPDEVEGPENTILVAEFSQSPNGIWGNSVGGGNAYKSHRPTNGIKSNQINNVFNGEGYAQGTQVWKLTFNEAMTAINNTLAAPPATDTTEHHISYMNPNAHKYGSNYLFVDGHAGMFTLQETLDQDNYMWGKRVYSCVDRPVIQDNP